MKTLLIIMIISSACLATTMNDLLDAIEQVESGGRADAKGDGGKAVGSYQLHKIYVAECNRILKEKRYSFSDRLDRDKSREITRIVLTYYKQRFHLDWLQTAACHNAGMYGWKNPKTNKYVAKIRKVLK